MIIMDPQSRPTPPPMPPPKPMVAPPVPISPPETISTANQPITAPTLQTVFPHYDPGNSPNEKSKQQAIEDFVKKNSTPEEYFNNSTATPTAPNPAKNNNPEPTFINNADFYGKVVSAEIHENIPKVISLISSLFFMITFSYTTVTILFVAVIIALAIALSNSGSPGFVYLKYYPKVGLLPIYSSAIAFIFMWVAFKLREGSRTSWFMAVISLMTLPVTFSLVMPVMTYPLIRLVSIYAGSAQKPLIQPSISLEALSQFFSVFLLFDAVLILLIIFLRYFKLPSQSLSNNAKTSLMVIAQLLCLPVVGVSAYGYYSAQTSDYGYVKVSQQVPYHIYYVTDAPGGRQFSTKFIPNEELGGIFNAVKVSYDVPLPMVMQTGKNSTIILKQVIVNPDFVLEKFISNLDRNADTNIDTVPLTNTLNKKGYFIVHGASTYLYIMMPDQVLVEISSLAVTRDDLINFAESLK
jgi:hypothetical protein